jgi:hypothetical protein
MTIHGAGWWVSQWFTEWEILEESISSKKKRRISLVKWIFKSCKSCSHSYGWREWCRIPQTTLIFQFTLLADVLEEKSSQYCLWSFPALFFLQYLSTYMVLYLLICFAPGWTEESHVVTWTSSPLKVLLECMAHGHRDSCLFCSLMDSRHPELCLEHSRYSTIFIQ